MVEKVIMASEIKQISPAAHQALVDQLEAHAAAQGKPITIEYRLHEAFKARSCQSKAIVRSGEVTPLRQPDPLRRCGVLNSSKKASSRKLQMSTTSPSHPFWS